MAVSPAAPRRRRPPAIAWILVLAVLVGLAAALLARPIGAVGPAPPGLAGLNGDQVGELLAVLAFAGLGVWIVLSLRDGASRVAFPPQVISTVLVMILLGVLFVEVAGLVHFTPLNPSSNGTRTPPPPGGTGTNVSLNGSPAHFGLPSLTLPGWAGAAILVGLAVVGGLLLVPYLVALAQDRRKSREDGDADTSKEAARVLEQALARLESGDSLDARATILALYARLLQILGPRLGALESRTPGEIERDAVGKLGLRRAVARELTKAFEEARYSTHAMTPEAVARAREALSQALADLSAARGVVA